MEVCSERARLYTCSAMRGRTAQRRQWSFSPAPAYIVFAPHAIRRNHALNCVVVKVAQLKVHLLFRWPLPRAVSGMGAGRRE